MKSKIFLFGLLTLMSFNYKASAQCLEEGNIIIDTYYGGPNFGKFVINTLEDNITGLNGELQTTGVGPMGGRVEYMLENNIGIQFDFIYNNFSTSGKIDSTLTDGSTETYDFTIDMQRFRPQVRLNYHFDFRDNMDMYFGLGAGANIRQYKFNTSYKNLEEISGLGTFFPISFRLAYGLRYFFTNNIGLNFELGIGGPVISGGLSVKL